MIWNRQRLGLRKRRKVAAARTNLPDGFWIFERPGESQLDALLLALLRLSAPVSCPFCLQSHRPPGPPACGPYREVSKRIAQEWHTRHG